jgi:diguanylate cyclase (GGDEF)-like protein
MKVLIADDEAISRRLLESSLRRWGYEPILASDGFEALSVLEQVNSPKLAILDWLMPGLSGLEVCSKIRRTKPEPYTYILLLTAKTSKTDVIQGLDAGADDYVAKPFDADELQVRLRTGKRILYLQDQLIAAREALREQATHDSLTGLWNHAAILEILSSELSRRKRLGGSLGIVLVDLDHFKQLNDEHGHAAGDTVLTAVANTMRCSTRPYDAVGRLGGEEFLIVLPGCDKINAVSHAERMRNVIGRISVETSTGRPVTVSASLGVTVVTDECDLDPTTLVHAADVALYRAKDNGRNRVEFTDPTRLMEAVENSAG